MSKEYYNYLAGQIVRYFRNTEILPGKKFIFPQSSEEDTGILKEELHRLAEEQGLYQKFVYACDNGEFYESFMIIREECSILVTSQEEMKTTLGFLTTLRNLVGKGEYRRFAILILCYEQLDSLSDGTERLDGEGMPLFYKTVEEDLIERLDNPAISEIDKKILRWHINSKNGYVNKDSLYEYKDVITLLQKRYLDKDDFHSIRLFYDHELYEQNFEEKQVEERVTDNGKKYEMIETAMRRGNLEEALEEQFRDSFIRELEEKRREATEDISWDQDLDYRIIKQEERKKIQGDTDLEIENSDIKIYQEEGDNKTGLECYIRNDGESKIKRRYKHILIFTSQKGGRIKIHLKCNKNIGLDKKDKKHKEENVLGQASGRNLYITIQDLQYPFGRGHYILNGTGESLAINFYILYTEYKYFSGISKLFKIERFKLNNKKEWGISIAGNENKILFQENKIPEEIVEITNGMSILYQPEERLGVYLEESEFGGNEYVSVCLQVENQEIPLFFKQDKDKPTKISGLMVEKRKLYEKRSFHYQDYRLSIGESFYYATEEFRENLQVEEQFVLNIEWLDDKYLPEKVSDCYKRLKECMRRMQMLPSLVYWEGECKQIAEECVRAVMECLLSAKSGSPLPNSVCSCLRLGMYKGEDSNVVMLTSFHPLNLAYQLALTGEMVNKVIREDIMKKLTSMNLIPYLTDDDGRLYRVQEQYDTPEWTYYRLIGDMQGSGTRRFVPGVVKEKIREYETHFSYLFSSIENVIKINAVNLGDCYELLTGIMKYYGEKTEQEIEKIGLRPIEVRVYQAGKENNYLEALSSKQVSKEFLDRVSEEESFRDTVLFDIWNRVQRHVRYYRKNMDDISFEYAHLTFYEMETDGEKGYGRMDDIKSSIMLGGLESGISSQQYGRSYRNGFGTKNVTMETELIQLAKVYNALYVVNGTSNPYEEGNCITTEIGSKDRQNIEKAYESSGWITFINPRVELRFFKEESNKDVIIVHYDDQYTSTSGYDAITVTRKTTQYRKVLEEYLDRYGISEVTNYTTKLIDMFNAINGNWLLKLVSSKNTNFSKEKISMLSAVKLALGYFFSKDIYWIPVSMEEILRISSAIGLSKDNGLFSAKNLGYQNIGYASDDLLMIGVLLDPDRVKVFFHQVEVKMGGNQDAKASKQVKNTMRILKETLIDKSDEISLEKKVYRNFLMQLAVIGAEKMRLYEVWNGYDWGAIIDTDIREYLLNDEFEISLDMEEYLGEGTVIAFKREIYTRNIQKKDNIYQLDFLFQDGVEFMLKDVSEIIHLLDHSTINSEILLKNSYSQVLDEAAVTVEDTSDIEEVREVRRTMRILFGEDELTGKEVYWYPTDTTKISHTNTGIIGTMGTGKTQFTKSLITQIVREQKYNIDSKPVGVLIFDYKGDYNHKKQDFMNAVKPKIYGLYHLPYNPFSLNHGSQVLPLLPIRVADTFKDTLARAYGLGVKQSSLLSDLIVEAYIRKGILPEDSNTWSKPAPTFEDVYRVYMEKEEVKKDDSLYSALSALHKYQIFEPDVTKTKSLFELIDGVMVVDLSSENETVQNLIVAITLDLFYSQMQAVGHSKIEGSLRQMNKMILVDEADNLLRVGFSSLRKILKEGREFGVGMILSTQFLKHFNTEEEDYASYIWTWIVHAVADFSAKDVKNVFAMDERNAIDALSGEIRRLNKHCSFVKMEQGKRPIKMQDKPFWQLI